MRSAFRRVVLSRPWLAFLTLCLSFSAFGAGTLNLFNLLRSNLALIADNGTMALADGAAQQLLELALTLVASMASYVVFKACEHALVDHLTHASDEDPVS